MRSLVTLLLLFNVIVFGQVNGFIPLFTNAGNEQLPKSRLDLTTSSRETQVQPSTEVIGQVLPSVVTIQIKKKVDQYVRNFDPFNPFGALSDAAQESEIEQNIGSGFVVAADGVVVTNRHVVEDENATYTVITNDKRHYEVNSIYRDANDDIALLKVEAQDLNPLPLGDSTSLMLGQPIMAIGTSLGEFTNSVTSGIISGLGRGITAGSRFEQSSEQLDDVIQTDAAINPGNSGGPIINTQGEVVGVSTAISSEGQNIGFAIPVNVVKRVISHSGIAI